MIEVVTKANIALFTDQLSDMHRMRHRVAVGELGWSLPDAHNGIDIDEYDTADTIYFLSLDDQGQVRACARLNPTTLPHLMSDLFSDMCQFSGVPTGSKIYELSRYLVERRHRPRREFLENRTKIIVALNEFCIANNIEKLSWLTYKSRYAEASTFWNTEPLGPARYFPADHADYIPAISDMTDAGLLNARVWAKTSAQTASVVRFQLPIEFASSTQLRTKNKSA